MSFGATKWAIEQRGLKPGVKLLLWQLADRHNKDTRRCDPSQQGLAEDCEISRATVNRYLDKLEEANLIRRVQRADPKTKRQDRTFYLLAFDTDLEAFDADRAVSQNVTRPVSQTATRPVSQKSPKPCLKNRQSRVSDCDTNPVREPIKEPSRACARETAIKTFGESVVNAAEFWAPKVTGGGCVPSSAISIATADAMIAMKLVTGDQLRSLSVHFTHHRERAERHEQ
ncbi:helix-turn-helix domain-containing protein [Roseovarius indicus]|jgi:DNA-binding MarR family transcriptional regulator|uniref:Putative transcriptional regulator n=1 Tax=Roseovarius indicus TaxID=540747 RepID=A0A5P3AKN9_9RHOB|nr:helix-turn-helix domain-containing protein [Roseovarius indicus]QEW28918.1 putative transcriptional regulator [Roseovarius indicus]SFD82636.1 Helix-turn-helix domain-containing protein [Roseovarius indicus]